MSIRFQHEEWVDTDAARAFALIDDLPATAKWLPPCVSLTKVGSGPNAAGDKLRYVYKQGGKQAEMEGQILERVPGQRLLCVYGDSQFDVSVDLQVASSNGGALTTHIIEITPKTFFSRLMSPIIRIGVRKQTRQAAANLKRLLES